MWDSLVSVVTKHFIKTSMLCLQWRRRPIDRRSSDCAERTVGRRVWPPHHGAAWDPILRLWTSTLLLTLQCHLHLKWQYAFQVCIFRCIDLSPLWTCYAFSPSVWHCIAC